jgi:hypothetical protein
MKKLFCFLAFILIITGCRSFKPPSTYIYTDTTSKTTTEKQIIPVDTVFFQQPDSAALYLLAECDSLNNVIIKELNNRAGEKIKITYRTIKDTIKQTDTLIIQSQIDSAEIAIRYFNTREITTKIFTPQIKQIEIDQERKIPTWIAVALLFVALITVGAIFRK